MSSTKAEEAKVTQAQVPKKCSPKQGFVCEAHAEGKHLYHNPKTGEWYSEPLSKGGSN